MFGAYTQARPPSLTANNQEADGQGRLACVFVVAVEPERS